jgi:hypothetical protein
MSYSENGLTAHNFSALTVSTAAEIARAYGPTGAKGRLVDIAFVETTDVTVADCTVQVGTAADPDAYGTLTVPFAGSVGDGVNGMVRGVTGEITADTEVLITAGGECTAGAGDIILYIQWS